MNGDADSSPEAPSASQVHRWWDATSARVNRRLEEDRRRRPLVDLAASLYERDRDAFATVLGSAIALRLFLFVVPAVVMLLGFLNTVNAAGAIDRLLDASSTSGELARSISDASRTSGTTGVGMFLSGLFLTVWAGRSLTRVLGAAAAAAWAVPARQARATLRSVAVLTSWLFAGFFAAAIINRVRELGGALADTASLAGTAGLFAVLWFFVGSTLPRASRDPGAQLPGAALVGIGFALVQWVMQAYLPGRIARSSEVMGSLSFTVAALGYFFFVGRLVTVSFVVNAVTFERFGSLSHMVFSLPLIRALPRRWPRLVVVFDLEPTSDDGLPPSAR